MQRCPAVIAFALAVLATAHALAEDALLPPSAVYQELFERVQLERVFEDSKTFADAVPTSMPAEILARYRKERELPDFKLRDFIASHFVTRGPPARLAPEASGADLRAYIDKVWGELVRQPAPASPNTSLLSLPRTYVVPGGRFDEIYYWDSYFTMRGLERSGRHDLVRAMLANFAWLVERFGHVPNGNRTYYLSRSQPPFLARMVDLVAERDGESVYLEYLGALEHEYAFWMNGADTLAPGEAHRRVVRLRDGSFLNRYWDDLETPRDEAYREDVETARRSGRAPSEVYRNLRAAAESGWDFSTRWLASGSALETIRTTELIPPDLNSLLYSLELSIARGCKSAGRSDCTQSMEQRADLRKAAMGRHLWNQDVGAFTDYEWRTGKKLRAITAATLYPLFVNASTPEQAVAVARVVRTRLLRAGGLATTEVRSGQQWDKPNGWAPLQWIAVQGLRNYGYDSLASTIAKRWMNTNVQLYRQTSRLFEKYDVERTSLGRGGEYSTQIGFGWTNGVLEELLALYPKLQQAQQPRCESNCQ